MIGRRRVMAGLAGLQMVVPRHATRSGATHQPDRFNCPAGACDTHVHVIGDPRQFALASDRTYTPPTASATELREMLRIMHIDRTVIVTPEVYGEDNAATLDAIRMLGQDRTRGVVWLPLDRSDSNLSRLKAAGIIGFRVLLDTKMSGAALRAQFQARFAIAARWGWHLDIATPPEMIAACLPQLAASPVPLVLDTFGWIQGGLRQLGVGAVLSLIRSGVAYVKLSEPYRLSDNAPDYPDLKPVVDALIAANPDRILWGSGWPFVSGPVPRRPVAEITPNLPADTGNLLNLFAAWVPNDGMRRKILVENPGRLYGFDDA